MNTVRVWSYLLVGVVLYSNLGTAHAVRFRCDPKHDIEHSFLDTDTSNRLQGYIVVNDTDGNRKMDIYDRSGKKQRASGFFPTRGGEYRSYGNHRVLGRVTRYYGGSFFGSGGAEELVVEISSKKRVYKKRVTFESAIKYDVRTVGLFDPETGDQEIRDFSVTLSAACYQI